MSVRAQQGLERPRRRGQRLVCATGWQRGMAGCSPAESGRWPIVGAWTRALCMGWQTRWSVVAGRASVARSGSARTGAARRLVGAEELAGDVRGMCWPAPLEHPRRLTDGHARLSDPGLARRARDVLVAPRSVVGLMLIHGLAPVRSTFDRRRPAASSMSAPHVETSWSSPPRAFSLVMRLRPARSPMRHPGHH